jgi:hypothetical protein
MQLLVLGLNTLAALILLSCARGLLSDNQPLENPPHVHSVGVGGDVLEVLFAEPTVCGQLSFGLTLAWNRPVQPSIDGP